MTPSVAQEPHPLAEEVGASGVESRGRIHFLSTTRFTITTIIINTIAKQRRRGVSNTMASD